MFNKYRIKHSIFVEHYVRKVNILYIFCYICIGYMSLVMIAITYDLDPQRNYAGAIISFVNPKNALMAGERHLSLCHAI